VRSNSSSSYGVSIPTLLRFYNITYGNNEFNQEKLYLSIIYGEKNSKKQDGMVILSEGRAYPTAWRAWSDGRVRSHNPDSPVRLISTVRPDLTFDLAS